MSNENLQHFLTRSNPPWWTFEKNELENSCQTNHFNKKILETIEFSRGMFDPDKLSRVKRKKVTLRKYYNTH